MNGCTIGVEDQFGPRVSYLCLQGFDFTLLFEESITTILPLGVTLLILLLRIARLAREPKEVFRSRLFFIKLVSSRQGAVNRSIAELLV